MFHFQFSDPKSKKPFLQKRTLETFLEKPTLSTHYPKVQITYRFCFQGIRKSREPFLQKRKKKNISNVLSQRKPHSNPKFTFQGLVQEKFQEAVLKKKKKKNVKN